MGHFDDPAPGFLLGVTFEFAGLLPTPSDMGDVAVLRLLLWAAEELDAPLAVTSGVMPVDQDPDSIARLADLVEAMSPFQLSAFHDLVAISGSLVLALAVTRKRLDAEAAWILSRIDEDWEIALWGEDEEAADVAARKRSAFLQADRFYGLCG